MAEVEKSSSIGPLNLFHYVLSSFITCHHHVSSCFVGSLWSETWLSLLIPRHWQSADSREASCQTGTQDRDSGGACGEATECLWLWSFHLVTGHFESFFGQSWSKATFLLLRMWGRICFSCILFWHLLKVDTLVGYGSPLLAEQRQSYWACSKYNSSSVNRGLYKKFPLVFQGFSWQLFQVIFQHLSTNL